MSVFSLSNKHIKKLVEISGELKDLSSTLGLLMWDQETYLTPRGALARAQQLDTLSGLVHQRATQKALGKLLEKLEEEIRQKPEVFTPFDKGLVKEMSREFRMATALPERLVRELSKESSLGLEAWKHARTQNDFSLYASRLTRMIELKKEVAHCYGFSDSPYDALLDEFEPGLTKRELHHVFGDLKLHLKDLIPTLTIQTAQYNHHIFSQQFDEEKLWQLSLDILKDIGFDLERGRQDRSTHPFTMGLHADDVRVTTRIFATNPISTIMSSIHEGGHGMYEQGIAPELAHTTMGVINSLVVHESQSRFWENMIGKSRAFWNFFAPRVAAVFPKQLAKIDAEKMWEEINLVQPSLIRVDADEVSYHMHIIIRTEIETELIEGRLKVEDVPERWNTAYKTYLEVSVPNDTMGCLQDIHWSQGLIGYFPTYSLGSMLSAQLFDTLAQQVSNIEHSIEEGKFEQPLHWLNEHIHQHGRLYSSHELCTRITGEPLSSKAFLSYLHRKFKIPTPR